MLSMSPSRVGVLMGVATYVLWGVLPIYLKMLQPLSPTSILAYRILWSLLLLALITLAFKRGEAVLTALRQPRIALALVVSTLLIGANWLIFIQAINGGHAIQVGLGYFINPLLNVLLGTVFLRERLGRAETIAVLLATAGVAALAIAQQAVPVIPLALALSFGLYGLVRKMIGVPPVEGLLIETMLLAPVALGWLLIVGVTTVGPGPMPPFWLIALSGAVTTLPLLLFNAAARRIPYSQLGLIQYISPTLQLIVAVQLFGEPLLPIHLLTFALIWTALIIYAVATWRRGRATPVVPE